MLKKIFLPWLVVRELDQSVNILRFENEYYRSVIDQLMAERARLRQKRDARGRFTK